MHPESPLTPAEPEDGERLHDKLREPSEALEEARFTTVEDVRFRAVLDEGVVIRQGVGEVLVVNAVGARILALIGEGLDLHRIVEALVGEFVVEEEELKKDVLFFTSELERAGVLERNTCDGPGAGVRPADRPGEVSSR